MTKTPSNLLYISSPSNLVSMMKQRHLIQWWSQQTRGFLQALQALRSSQQTRWWSEMTTMQIDDCAICLERWRCEGDHQICCLRSCGHLFCFSCIIKCIPESYEVSAECPMCRMPFRWPDVRKIYGSPVTLLDEDLLDRNQRLEEEEKLLTDEIDNLLKENTKLKKQMNMHRASLVKKN